MRGIPHKGDEESWFAENGEAPSLSLSAILGVQSGEVVGMLPMRRL